MQRVFHEYRNKSRIFSMIEELYTYVSDTDYMFDDILWLDESFAGLCEILQSYLLIFNTPKLKKFNIPKIPCRHVDNKEITVCLSGGKDSAACAYYYIQRGYKVHLYHAASINRAYGDEKTAAMNIADYLGCDLFIDKLKLTGPNKFIEHPLKNYLIANGAIHYCLAMGYTPHIAFGNFNKSILAENEFEVCGGDCIDMWNVYKPIIQTALPEFDIQIPLETNADTFNILSDDWKLFSMCVSCMSPFRFREHWKHRTEERYNVRIFNNRCGCCWKCCVESIWLMDTGNMEYDEKFYMHCIEILARSIYKETGSPAETVDDVWNNYMFYPMKESKAYDSILKYKIPKRFT